MELCLCSNRSLGEGLLHGVDEADVPDGVSGEHVRNLGFSPGP
jgi:hypothetical protein